MMFELKPKNNELFERLIIFAKKVFKILDNNNIEYVIYGSFAFFYYTKDISLSVNDIDLMIHKEDKKKLPALLKSEGIEFEEKEDDFFIRDGDLLIEADGWGFSDKELTSSIEINYVLAYDTKVNIISLDNVELIYSMARDYKYNSDQDKILKKIEHLESFLGRKLKY